MFPFYTIPWANSHLFLIYSFFAFTMSQQQTIYKALLAHISRYVSIPGNELQPFLDALELRKFGRHEYLLHEGEICRHDHFVIKGGMRQYEFTADGREHTIYFGFEDWWLADRYSLITQTPSIYNIQALEPTEVLQINQLRLQELFTHIPRLENYFHLVLQQAFATWQSRILLLQKTGEEKYSVFLRDYGHIEQRLSQQHIASYLGITRETLSRIRKQFAGKK